MESKMMINKLCLAVLINLLLLINSGFTQDESNSINVAGIFLRIGMGKKAVINKFKAFDLRGLGDNLKSPDDCNSYIIMNKDGPPYVFIGSLSFKDGKLKSVSKSWSEGYKNNTLSEFIQALYALFSNTTGNATKAFIVTTDEQREPQGEKKEIIFTTGSKTIRISYLEGFRAGGEEITPSILLNEELEELK
jgi:hypothetical protein